MPNPKRKHTRSRRDSRRAKNWTLDLPSFVACSNPACGKLRPPHRVCPHCGFYGDRVVVEPKAAKQKGEEGGGAAPESGGEKAA